MKMFTGGAHTLVLPSFLPSFLFSLTLPSPLSSTLVFVRGVSCCSLHSGNTAHWHLQSLRPSCSDYGAGRTLGSTHLLNCNTLPGTDREAEIFQCSVMKPNPFNLLPISSPSTSNLPQITLFHIFSISSAVIKKKKYDAEYCGRT